MNDMTASDAGGLRLEGLHKSLGGRRIIKNVTLHVQPGELVCLLGPSGCGKTTTLRMIAGFLHPDRGSVWMDGVDVTDLGAEKRPSALVFQNYALWPHMTVERNVSFPLRVAKRPKGEIVKRVDAALEMVNLTARRNVRPSQMSGGEQQRAALARALVQEPSILLLDEPLSNLDAKLREKVREDIREIQQRLGLTTIMVPHDQQEAMAVSDRIAVMHDGVLEQISKPEDLYTHPNTENIARFIGTMSEYDKAFDPKGYGVKDHWLVRPEDVVYAPQGQLQVTGQLPSFTARLTRVIPHGRYEDMWFDAFDGTTIIGLRPLGDTRLHIGDQVDITASKAYHYHDNQLKEILA